MPATGILRNSTALVSAVAVIACTTTQQTRWERPGANDYVVARDASDCSAIAYTEAERLHPYPWGVAATANTADSPGFALKQHVESERFAEADRLLDLCMRTRGYERKPFTPAKAP